MRKEPKKSFWKVWGWPSILAILIEFGLFSALLGQGGIWWILSWVALGFIVLVIIHYALWPIGDIFKKLL